MARRTMMRDRMRDMARQRRDMASRRMRDSASYRGDMNYDMGMGNDYRGRQSSSRYGDSTNSRYDYARNGRDYESGRQSRSDYGYYDMTGRDMTYGDMARRRGSNGRYMSDRASGMEYISDEELHEWKEDLMQEIEPQFQQMYEKNKVLQRASEMGVDFRDFTEDEFVVTALMIATDYGKTVGMENTDKIYRMAYNFLDDPDSDLKGSEKLASYYYNVVCAE